jgi:hypothetical protein
MLERQRVFAAAAAAAVFAVLTGAHAQSAFIDLPWPRDHAAITKAGYYDRGFYGYREDFYGGNGLFDLPGTLIGGLAGLFEGVLGGGYNGDSYYYRPRYVSPYYGSPVYAAEAYDREPYRTRTYDGGTYYFDPYYGSRRPYEVRRYESDGAYRDRSDYDSNRGYNDEPYNAWRYKGLYEGDAYVGRRVDDAYDDDD